MRRRTVGAAVLVAVLGGCAPSTPPPGANRPHLYTAADAVAATLTARDLPSGYLEHGGSGETASAALSPCARRWHVGPDGAGPGASTANFSRGARGTLIDQSIILAPSIEAAHALLRDLSSARATCPTWAVEGETYAVGVDVVVAYGDESEGFALTGSGSFACDLTLYALRRGNLVDLVVAGGADHSDLADRTAAVAAAAAKLPGS